MFKIRTMGILTTFVLKDTDFGTCFLAELARGIAEAVGGDDGVGVHEENDGSNSTGASIGGPGTMRGG